MFSCVGCGDRCQTDDQCDDGLFCNGAETCRPGCDLRGAFGLDVCDGPKICTSAPSFVRDPCCTAGSPKTSACESACNEADDTCEPGEECITDADCDPEINCSFRYFCQNGYCFRGTGHMEIESGAADLAECREACVAAGFPLVDGFVNRDDGLGAACYCTIEKDTVCNGRFARHHIWDPENRGCEVVCDAAGWPATQGIVPEQPDRCLCGIAD